jgi:hypothetical protein
MIDFNLCELEMLQYTYEGEKEKKINIFSFTEPQYKLVNKKKISFQFQGNINKDNINKDNIK